LALTCGEQISAQKVGIGSLLLKLRIFHTEEFLVSTVCNLSLRTFAAPIDLAEGVNSIIILAINFRFAFPKYQHDHCLLH
jgi:hypothetical protein